MYRHANLNHRFTEGINMAQIRVEKVVPVINDCTGDYFRVIGTIDGKPLDKEVPIDGVDDQPPVIVEAIRGHENILPKLWE